jgi:hypothetical protein
MIENKSKKERQCIAMLTDGKSYYDGNAGYSSDFSSAKIYNESEVPEDIKRNTFEEKIIFLDTEEGLELLVKEFKDNQHYAEIYGSRVKNAEETMKKLYSFDSVRKYIELHNKWYNPLIGISADTEKKIIEEIVAEKK